MTEEAVLDFNTELETPLPHASITPSSFHTTIERNQLLRLLSHVQPVVERRHTIPVLANVLLQATEGKLRVTATDMDMLVTEETTANVEEEGTITVSAQILYEIIRKLPQTSVSLRYQPATQLLEIRADASHFSLPTLPAELFPLMDAGALPHRLVLASSELQHLIDNTHYAMSTEETRYYLNGVYLQPLVQEGDLFLAAIATDGHRLARGVCSAPAGLSPEVEGIILPKKLVHELRKLLEDVEGEVILAFSKSKVEFVLGTVRLISKLVDATFPDCQAVIPQQWKTELVLPRKALIERLDRISIVVQEKNRGVRLCLQSGQLLIAASGEIQGSGLETLPVEYQGQPLELSFNVRYLLEALQVHQGDEVCCCIVDAFAPILLLDTQRASTALAVVMPMRM